MIGSLLARTRLLATGHLFAPAILYSNWYASDSSAARKFGSIVVYEIDDSHGISFIGGEHGLLRHAISAIRRGAFGTTIDIERICTPHVVSIHFGSYESRSTAVTAQLFYA